MPFVSVSPNDIGIEEQTSLHCFGVLSLRAKKHYILGQISLLKWSLFYLIMTSLCLKSALGSSVILLLLAVILIIICLYNESENLRNVQSQLIELVNNTPLQVANALLDDD